jgi:glycosyltransferase involved in cell wall biosynthesis
VAKARILEITSYPPPRAGWGVRVEYVKKQLEADGHECVVLNLGQARKIPSPEYETVLDGWDFVRKVWRYSSRGFLVHMHGNGDSPKGFVLILLAGAINLLWGRRCVLTFHAGVDQIFFPRPKYPWLLPVFKLIFGIPRQIVCNSPAVKARIVEYGVPADKVFPIPAFSRQYLDHTPGPLPPAVDAFYGRFASVVFTYIRIREGFYLDTLLEGFAKVAAERPDAGLAFCGVSGDIDPRLMEQVNDLIARLGLGPRVCIIDDLDHDQFLTALSRSALYLRTPTTDGVASSVLESLALGVPVVGADNGTRPPGVILYPPTDAGELAARCLAVVADRAAASRAIPPVDIRDTVADEVSLLTS